MTYEGTIIRIQRSSSGVALIVDTAYGLRGIELDPDLWETILRDAGLDRGASLAGWRVEYDPASGDLDLIQPDAPSDATPDGTDPSGPNA